MLAWQAGVIVLTALAALLVHASKAETYELPPGSYDPGLYTPFTHAPTQPHLKRPAHPFSIYRPPGYEGK